jgi:hypothetical protein
MKRAVWIAVALAATISGAAAIGIDAQSTPAPAASTHLSRAATLEAARRAQREAIDARYQADRAKCDDVGGVRRDRCLIEAHARKGRALLEAATPYATRNS